MFKTSDPVAYFKRLVGHGTLDHATDFLRQQDFASPPQEWKDQGFFLKGMRINVSAPELKRFYQALQDKGFAQDNPLEVAQALLAILSDARVIPLKPVVKQLADFLKPHTHLIQGELAARLVYQSAVYTPSVCKTLVRAGLPVDAVDDRGWYALWELAGNANAFKAFQTLLKLGANPNGPREGKYPPLLRAAQGKYIHALLDCRVDVNACDARGCTALMLWAKQLDQKPSEAQAVLERLVQMGADVNVRDHEGNTVVDMCKNPGSKEFLKQFCSQANQCHLHTQTPSAASRATSSRRM